MKFVSFAAMFAMFLTVSPQLFAGPGHSHDYDVPKAKVDDQGAIAAASSVIARLIKQQQPIEGAALDSAWETIPEADKKISKKGKGYYIVSFTNTAAAKTLYALLSDTGVVYDLNYSGKFSGLKD